MFANVNFFLLFFFGGLQLMSSLEGQNANWQLKAEVRKEENKNNDSDLSENSENFAFASTVKSLNKRAGSDSTNPENGNFILYASNRFLESSAKRNHRRDSGNKSTEIRFMDEISEKQLTEYEWTMMNESNEADDVKQLRKPTTRATTASAAAAAATTGREKQIDQNVDDGIVENVSQLHQDVIDLAPVGLFYDDNIKAQPPLTSGDGIEQLPVAQSLVASSHSAKESQLQYQQYMQEQRLQRQQNHQYHQLQRRFQPIMADGDNDGNDGIEQNEPLPVFPERSDAVYFIVAVIGGAKVWARTLARTLMEMGTPFGSPLGPPLRPLYVDLPANGRFSVNALTSLCQQTEGVPLAGVVVIGDGQSARAIAMSGHSMQIPVLWARGGTANIRSTQSQEEANLQTILQPSAREILEAIRALFLQTHWHSFFVLSDVEATMVLTGSEGVPLKRPPLRPTILPLPPSDGDVFRQLAEISRSTRGIVLLLCNLVSARNVMSEAKRLNMAGGHFIWLWADTSSTAEFFDVNKAAPARSSSSSSSSSAASASSTSASSSSSMSSSSSPSSSGVQNSKTRPHLQPKSHSVATAAAAAAASGSPMSTVDEKILFDYSAIPAAPKQFANGFNLYKNVGDPPVNHQRFGEKKLVDSNPMTNDDILQQWNEKLLKMNANVDSPTGSDDVKGSPENGRYTIGINSADHSSASVEFPDHTAQIKNNDKKATQQKINTYDDDEKDEFSYEDTEVKSKEDSFQIDENSDDGKNFEAYYKYLQQRNDSEVNRNHMKPKRTSSDSISSTLHFGLNGSSSHVLFHHFKDFPIGLLALRPKKMAVDRNFIRSAIRLFASTWAQVQIDDDDDNDVVEENVRKRSIITRNTVIRMQSSASQRKRRRRRRRRQVENKNNSRQVNNYLSEQELIINNNRSSSSSRSSRSSHSEIINSNFSSYKSKNKNNSNSNNNNNKINISKLTQISSDSLLNKTNSNFYKTNVRKTNQNSSGLIDDRRHQIEKRSQSKLKSNKVMEMSKRDNNEDKLSKRDASNTWWSVGNGKKQQQERQQQPNWYDLEGFGREVDGMTESDEHDRDNLPFTKSSVTPCFRGGCFGVASRTDVQRAQLFANALKKSTAEALAGDLSIDGVREHPLITNFEILNLVPADGTGEYQKSSFFDGKSSAGNGMRRQRKQRRLRYSSSKWRRVGLISGRSVHLDTIVWPGGDIVVSGLSARSRTIFRIVTALAPPFVMQSELDEDGMCLRGLPCHRLMPNNHHNLTLMFNAIETKHRLNEDIAEHGGRMGSSNHDDLGKTFDHSLYETKCCYGLSMDLLDNIATELEFEFHLYLVHDSLFGSRFSSMNDFVWTRPSSSSMSAKSKLFANQNTMTTSGQSKQDGMGSNSKRTTSNSNSNTNANNKNKQQTKLFETSKEEQSGAQQRRYHSPEGRTKTRRHSGSFEREKSENRNNNNNNNNDRDTESFNRQTFINKNESPTKVTSITTPTGDGNSEPLNNWTNARIRANRYEESTNNADTDADDDDDDGGNVNENDNDNQRYRRLRRHNGDSDDWLKMKQEFADDYDYHSYDAKDNNRRRFSRSSTTGNRKKPEWNGIIGDLISGAADMSFAPLTVSRSRAEVIDFSAPYFHGSISLLAAPQSKSEIPLLAFLLPFSPELWIAIFTSLNVTAIAVAIYEWLSPFGLNPWGRQRSKNFSMSSALWVMWGLLCGHLVAFKAPKSWPNKFLINVWGGFSVIFIASYTANIAALIAGLFFHNSGNTPEVSLFTQRVGAPISSATEAYLKQHRPHEWEHIKKFSLRNIEEGIQRLKNGSLDLLIGDTPVLDYYRAIDHGCNLLRLGETYVEDTYAIGMKKGFPLKDSISALIAKYSSNGYLDILADKWYGGLPCFKMDSDIIMPRPLGVAAVAGVFLLLGLGMTVGVIILIFEHWFYKYILPKLRHKPKGTVWRSRNIMFFSQKLYRFINCVELVSPHHAARELVDTLRQGQIASLFQKSIKRKEDEQRRRRKSKAQFFEMIQEIRRVQQAERLKSKLEVLKEAAEAENVAARNTANVMQIPEIITPHSRSPKLRLSPRPKIFSARSSHKRSRSNSSTLSVRRYSNDSVLSDRLDTIGRRLSRDLTNSPPDFANRKFDSLSPTSGGSMNKFDTFSGRSGSTDKIEETKFDTYSYSKSKDVVTKKFQNRRIPLNVDMYKEHKCDLSDEESKDDEDAADCSGDDEQRALVEYTDANTSSLKSNNSSSRSPSVGFLPIVREGQVTSANRHEDRAQAILRERMHEELITKYGDSKYESLPISRTSIDGNMTPPQTASQRTSFRIQVRSPAAALKRNRQLSLDGLEQRPRLPSPPRIVASVNHKAGKVAAKATKPPRRSPKTSSKTNSTQTQTQTQTPLAITNRKELSLDRIKRNDTLRLYASSVHQPEVIKEYPSKARAEKALKPP